MAEENNEHGKTFHTWKIPEFDHQDRSVGWYFAAILVGLALLIGSIWSRNYLFGVIIIMIAFIIAQQQSRKPELLDFTITEDGIGIGPHTFFDYRQLKHFWIVYEPPKVKRLYVSFRSSIRPELGVPLNDENPVKIRETLLRFLQEDTDREGDSATESLGRMLKI